MSQNQQLKIAWGFTGAGHFLAECVALCQAQGSRTDVFLSGAAAEVLQSYGLLEQLQAAVRQCHSDRSQSAQSMTRLYGGGYRLLVIAPATANSVAKMALGIADNLVTNLFAQAGKLGIPTLVLPCDGEALIQSPTPQGRQVALQARPLDLRNIELLRGIPGTRVALNPAALASMLVSP